MKHEVMIKAASSISERKKSEITEITGIYILSQQYLVINNLIAVGNSCVELSLLLKGTACQIICPLVWYYMPINQ